jgi:membrane protease YdiL (CAAX protease family)
LIDTSPLPPPRWHPALRSVLLVLAFLLLQIVATVAVAAVRYAAGRDPIPTGESLLLVFAFAALPFGLVTALFLRLFDRRDLASIGVRPPSGGARRALGQAAVVPLAVLGFLAAWLLAIALVPSTAVRVAGWSGEMAGPAGVLHLALLLAGFLVQGGSEELLVRGYVYQALRQRWRRSTAMLSSALLFAVLHGANPDVSPIALLNTFLAGIILAFLVERSGSLWSATLAHGVWNFAVSCLVSLPISGVRLPHLLAFAVDGPALLTGDGFGPEGSLLLSLLAAAVAAALGRGLPPEPSKEPHMEPENGGVSR